MTVQEHSPKNLTDAERMQLQQALWGNARRNPEKAKQIWTILLAGSLRVPLTREARQRLDWFVAYNTTFKGNTKKTCRYFGISRKTFYVWKKRFDVTKPQSLENGSHRPKVGPLPVLDPEQSQRLFFLRSAYPLYSKMKIAAIYERQYGTKISSWQVQKIIERYQLYPDVKRARRLAYKRQYAEKKQRITKLIKEPKTGFLVSIDTVILRQGKATFSMFTALDRHSRWGFARVYKTHSSKNAAEFLHLLNRNMRGTMRNVQTDNGTEFHRHFQKAVLELKLGHYWSRVRTPKDNSQLERFNRTLREEFLPPWKDCTDMEMLNGALIQWMVDYNDDRPHMALSYRTPNEAAWGDEKCYQSPLH